MSFLHSKGFKYFKNLIIGVGASVVLLGALEKINSTQIIPGVDLITIGLVVEALLFLFLGLIGPEKDYYWEKLYPGLDDVSSSVTPLAATASAPNMSLTPALNGQVVEQQLGGMLTELQSMSKSLGSLKALQEVDFSGTSDQIRTMNNFYTKLNEAMADLGDSLEDTRRYKEHMSVLNRNLSSLNSVYGNMLGAMAGVRRPEL
ncbi:MAG: gliding motility protein GldL [Saprospiraceae bacterium]|nr:gliding motility protein GldL [Saprospiraceae bacterium]